jgi:hypothetical protein
MKGAKIRYKGGVYCEDCKCHGEVTKSGRKCERKRKAGGGVLTKI